MKICFKCGVLKPLKDYYKHSRMADGHLNKCKECTKKDVKQHREDNIDKILEYDRNRPNREERNRKTNERVWKLYYTDTEFRQRILNQQSRWVDKHPLKRKAQTAATNAVRYGKLERKFNCEDCGCGGKLHKHHHSYEKEFWLDIKWLCPKCHGKEHKRLNDLVRQSDEIQTEPASQDSNEVKL